MTGLNLHNIVADALAELNPWKELVFTKTSTEWSPDNFVPDETAQTITVRGKLQPASIQELQEIGFDLQAYEYFTLFISADVTQLDNIRQFGSDEFTCEGFTYRIVAKEDWIQNGWRQAYCYLIEETPSG